MSRDCLNTPKKVCPSPPHLLSVTVVFFFPLQHTIGEINQPKLRHCIQRKALASSVSAQHKTRSAFPTLVDEEEKCCLKSVCAACSSAGAFIAAAGRSQVVKGER